MDILQENGMSFLWMVQVENKIQLKPMYSFGK